MNKHTQVLAARESGMVERCHATPHIGTYNVGQHCYGAVSLILLLHPNPSVNLIKAVQFHDVPERWYGDIPSTGKVGAFRQEFEELEAQCYLDLDMVPLLTDDEADWLKAVDILDLWLWSREQIYLGNLNAVEIRMRCEAALNRLAGEGDLPTEALSFYDDAASRAHSRLSSVFSEVVSGS